MNHLKFKISALYKMSDTKLVKLLDKTMVQIRQKSEPVPVKPTTPVKTKAKAKAKASKKLSIQGDIDTITPPTNKGAVDKTVSAVPANAEVHKFQMTPHTLTPQSGGVEALSTHHADTNQQRLDNLKTDIMINRQVRENERDRLRNMGIVYPSEMDPERNIIPYENTDRKATPSTFETEKYIPSQSRDVKQQKTQNHQFSTPLQNGVSLKTDANTMFPDSGGFYF
jgi:hypothetical protein